MAFSLQENENKHAAQFSALTPSCCNLIMFINKLISPYNSFMRQVGRDRVTLCPKLGDKSPLRLI
jgi:hypothetical protein